ncbi:MAG: thioredoxin domain-containing protein, partial [Acidobacteria bacterium]|nr:thioredoxin domain-containing protein [Acidobacteriota bacterium]
EFAGKNILYRAHAAAGAAGHFGKPLEEVRTGILQARRKLLAARQGRPHPHLDDKVLTAWNGLMISALARAGAVLNEPAYLDAAVRAVEFLDARMRRPDGVLLRRYRQGEAAIPGFLDDYAFLAQGLLDLYGAGLTEKQSELFEDRQAGGFYSVPADDAGLPLRVKDDYDGAEPSGNSIAALNLLRLARITDRGDLRRSAERTLDAFAGRVQAMPAGLPQMLAACEFALAEPREVVVVGEKSSADTLELLRVAHARFLPSAVLLLVENGRVPGGNPALAALRKIEGRATAYVCRNYACELPTTDPARFAELLQ